MIAAALAALHPSLHLGGAHTTALTHRLKEVMPTSSHAFLFIRTYVCESFRSPTMMTARPGA